ncbi:Uncharacterised protein [Serratia ficaria]|uniref:hypothetical protein n=1 Tax=Serratia ficaria TaxID=61651 RepID=UPI00217CAEA5|nr:hypothetical protein [Serratia ficaria]CAI1650930.1 Uncharacterised protein [Serratia ficaria]
MFKNLMLFVVCFVASFFILNKISPLKWLVDTTVNQIGDWMNSANWVMSDGEFDPAFLTVVLVYMLIVTVILMAIARRVIKK